jgi:hypothetical protein
VVVGLLALQVVLALVGAGLWLRATYADDELSGERPLPAADVVSPVTLESALPLAIERASEWDEGARLVLAGAQLDWPLEVPPGPVRDLPGGGWLTYVFVRAGDGDAESLSLLIERHSGAIVQEAVANWGGSAPAGALDLSSYAIGSVDALVAAENAGGTEFRRECPEARHLTRVSLSSADPAPIWFFGYRDIRDGGAVPLAITVDATSGTVSVDRRDVSEAAGCPI